MQNPIYAATVTAAKGNTVNMRSEPSTKGDILTRVSVGTDVDVLGIVAGDDGEWGHILYGNKNGYMMNKYLIPIGAAEDTNKTETDEISVSRTALKAAYANAAMAADMLRKMIGGDEP